MKVLFNPSLSNKKYISGSPSNNSISFGIKKSELGAVNKFVFENCFPTKQKPDIQKFKVIEEFYKDCKKWVDNIIPKDFGGRKSETKIQRKSVLNEWYEYLTSKNQTCLFHHVIHFIIHYILLFFVD